MSSTHSTLRFYRAALQSCGYEPLRLQTRMLRSTHLRWRAALPISAHGATSSPFSTGARAQAASGGKSKSSPAGKITDRSRVLAQPERYTPPSHPPRHRKSAKLHYYGGELSGEAKLAQDRRQYPHMMPPEDSWKHWFLTSRALHTTITLGVLSTLAVVVFCLEFKRKTPYLELLPTWSNFFAHPFASTRQAWDVYVMDSHYHTQQVQEMRERDLEDARKRKAYRVAHGMENPTYGLQGTAPGLEGIAFGEKEVRDKNVAEEVEFERKVKQAYLDSIERAGGDPKVAEDWAQRKEKGRPIKKWFGIWGSE